MMLFRLPILTLFFTGLLFAQQKVVPHLTREGGIFKSTLMLTNQSDQMVTYRLSPFDVNGTPLPYPEEVRAGEMPPHTALTYTQGDRLPPGTSHVIVEMSSGLDVAVLMSAKDSPAPPARVTAVETAARAWRIDPGNWDEVFDAFAIVNTGESATNIQIRHIREDGSLIETVAPESLSHVPPLAKRLFVLNGAFLPEPNTRFEIVSDQPTAMTALTIDFRNTFVSIEDSRPSAVEEPGFTFGLSSLSPEDRAQVDAFRDAWQRFKDLDEEAFLQEYASQKNYRTSLDYNPMEAANLDLILEHFPLSDAQTAAFHQNGFVITGNYRSSNFFSMYKDLFLKHLPVYISVDAVLDALHLSFDRMLGDLEENILHARLDVLLEKMDKGLENLRGYAERDMDTELDDLAFWICTARSLLTGEQAACSRDVSEKVSTYLGYIAEEKLGVTIQPFGKRYSFDFSQFKVRGHYTRSKKLQRYFRAMMWVQRMGMDFTDNPRDAAAAFLLTRSLFDTGAIEDWQTIDKTLKALVGDSDSLNPAGMVSLTEGLDIASIDVFYNETAFDAFRRSAVERGAGLQRINSMLLQTDPTEPGGFVPFPPKFFALGQRFIVDSYVFTNMVFPRVNRQDKPIRYLPRPEEAMFALGSRAATPILAEEVRIYGHQANLAAMDWLIGGYEPSFWESNLYNRWLSALRVLNTDTTGPAYPSVMATEPWERRVLQSQMGSWAHLRHDTLLYAKASFTGIVCEYPDGWVDPYPEFFETLGAFARQALTDLRGLGIFDYIGLPPDEEPDQVPFTGRRLVDYLLTFESNMEKLAELARAELDQEPLKEEQLQYINNLVQYGICGGPDFTGWYPDMIYGYNDENAEVPDPTIADVHTDPNTGDILHVGTALPGLMLISVANDCGVRSYVGPVISYRHMLNRERLTDEAWRGRLRETGSDTRTRPDWTADIVIDP